jgi:hypothetical protein
MIIQEDFDKLKQNDRIEFLLRENRLDEKKYGLHFNWGKLALTLFALLGFIIILGTQFCLGGLEETAIEIFETLIPVTTIIAFVIVLGLIWNTLHQLLIFPKLDKELESYFFEEEKKKPKK